MPLSIPNAADAAFADQAEPDSGDFAILSAAHAATGVVVGCAVTAQGSPDMTCAVAVGTVIVAGVKAAVAAGNVTITAANGTNPRFDLVVVSAAGVKSVTAGTASSNPAFPTIPASSVVLAAVYVPASDTAIGSTQIVDKRVFLSPRPDAPFQFRTGRYYSTQLNGIYHNGNSGPVGQRLYAVPFYLGRDQSFDRIGIQVTTGAGSAVVRLGAYLDSNGYPGALISDYGTVDASSSGAKEITITLAATAPLIWLSAVEQVTDSIVLKSMYSDSERVQYSYVIGTATGVVGNTQVGFSQNGGAAGALPTPYPSSVASTTEVPIIWLRAA